MSISLYTHADQLTTYGFGNVLKMRAQDITIEVNSGGKLFGGAMRSTADFASSFPAEQRRRHAGRFKCETGGKPVYLNFTGDDLIGLDIGMADIQVSEFLSLRGSLAFRKGERYIVNVDLGGLSTLADQLGPLIPGDYKAGQELKMSVETLTLGGSNLTGFVGIGGPYRYGVDANGDGLLDNINDGAVGLVLDNVDFGLAIMTPSLAGMIPGANQIVPNFVTAKAHVDYAGLVGIDPSLMDVRAQDISININTSYIPALGAAGNAALQIAGPAYINYQTSFPATAATPSTAATPAGFALPTGGGTSILLDYDSEIVQAKVAYAQINLAGFVQLSASMAFTKRSSESVTLSTGETTKITSLAIGINDAYGFIGVGGYWQDSNGDGRINELDTTTGSGVGLAIKNLDLGLIVASELKVGLDGITVGVYLAADAAIDSIGLVGVPGAELVAESLSLNLNTGLRASIHSGFTIDASGNAIYSDAGVSFALTTIDLSKSVWRDSNNVEHTGYAIETGNPDEPVVLLYTQQYLRVAGKAKVNLFDLVKMDGAFDITASASGLVMFVDVEAAIGSGDVTIASHATGLLSVTAAGVAMRVDLSKKIDLGALATLDASLTLALNTTGQDVTYIVPEAFRDVVHFDNNTYTISATPPGKPDWNGMYVALFGEGELSLMGDALKLEGSFAVVISETGMELTAKAVLKLPLLEPLSATGTLGIVSGGLYGALEIGGAGASSVLIDGGAFEVTGHFLLQVNTTSTAQTVRAINPAGGFMNTQLGAQALHIAGNAGISLAGGAVNMDGAMDLLIDSTGVQASADMALELGVLGSIDVSGAIAFIEADEGTVFALRLATHVKLGTGLIGIDAAAVLEINTSDTTSYAGVAAGTTFNLDLDGSLHVLAFDIDFHGGMRVQNDVFRLELNASLDFFGFTRIAIGGYIESDGDFEINGSVGIHVGMGPLSLNAGMSITLSNTRFAASVYGSLELDIDLGLFSITATLAGFSGSIELTEASAHLAASVTIVGISVDADYFWSWGDPPVITTQIGSTLYLNMGDEYNRYGSNGLYDKTVNETYQITQDDKGVVSVTSMGVVAKHSGVTRIVARGGSGNDAIYVGDAVTAVLDFDGGAGNDNFTIIGGAAGSIIRGGDGKDNFLGGFANGIRYEGGAGNDRFVGNDADEIVDMGAGANVIFAAGGNDTIYSNGGTDTIDTGAGDNLIFISGGGYAKVTAGGGYDRLIIAPLITTTAIQRNEHQLRIDQRVIDFNSGLDRIEITDTAATTRITSGNGASWGATDMIVKASGLVDVRGAVFIAPDALLSIEAIGLQGTLNTQLAELSVLNTGAAGNAYSAIVVREADDLHLVGSGLQALHGAIDVELAGREALLSLDAGKLSTAASGADIRLVADDIDLRSGDDSVAGLGALLIQAKSANQSYHLGARRPVHLRQRLFGTVADRLYGAGHARPVGPEERFQRHHHRPEADRRDHVAGRYRGQGRRCAHLLRQIQRQRHPQRGPHQRRRRRPVERTADAQRAPA